MTESGEWAVVQQGMSVKDRTARRYHWVSLLGKRDRFVVEPHAAVVGDVRREFVLNMTAKESEGCRFASVDFAKEHPKRIRRMVLSTRPAYQKSLGEWVPEIRDVGERERSFDVLTMPRNLNWEALRKVYDFQPANYEELLGFRGIGPSTIRGLALISELIYDEKPSWKDPVKYSFAYGGKDGVPYRVNRKAMDESFQVLEHTS